jgi:hypothetical protein
MNEFNGLIDEFNQFDTFNEFKKDVAYKIIENNSFSIHEKITLIKTLNKGIININNIKKDNEFYVTIKIMKLTGCLINDTTYSIIYIITNLCVYESQYIFTYSSHTYKNRKEYIFKKIHIFGNELNKEIIDIIINNCKSVEDYENHSDDELGFEEIVNDSINIFYNMISQY